MHLFSLVFERTDILYKILQSKSLDIEFCIRSVEGAIYHFEKLRQHGFEGVWDLAVNSEDVSDAEPERRRGRPRADGSLPISTKDQCKSLMTKVLTKIIDQLKSRFSNFSSLKFVELVCPEKFETYAEIGKFPTAALESLSQQYPTLIDIQKLKSELHVVYDHPHFRNCTLSDLHEKLASDPGLSSSFSQTKKLCSIVMCLPSTSVTAERSFSAMRRIKTYLRSTISEERFSSLAFLSIEKEFVSDLQKWNKRKFYDNVITEFTKKSRRMEFTFR